MENQHVHKGIAAVLADLAEQGVSKNRKNQAQGFSFRGVDDIYQALSPLLAKHGIYLAPSVGWHKCEQRTTAKGATMYSVTLQMQYRIYSSVDGSYIDTQAIGEAMDSGDKATSKAMSMAYKYLAFQLFCIPLEGSDDADYETPPPTTAKRAPVEIDQSAIVRQLQGATKQTDLEGVADQLRNTPEAVRQMFRDAFRQAQTRVTQYAVLSDGFKNSKTKQAVVDYLGEQGILVSSVNDIYAIPAQHIAAVSAQWAKMQNTMAL